MAFDVTPTSGDAPYTFTVSYTDKSGFDLGLFSAEFRTVTAVGSCPTGGTGTTNDPVAALALLETGSTTIISSVPSGSCRRYISIVRSLSDNVIVSQESLYIDNI